MKEIIRTLRRHPGFAAAQQARLLIVIALCVFQYWLLTTGMEAYHSGNGKIVLASAIASFACFILATGLILAGEMSWRRMVNHFGRDHELVQK